MLVTNKNYGKIYDLENKNYEEYIRSFYFNFCCCNTLFLVTYLCRNAFVRNFHRIGNKNVTNSLPVVVGNLDLGRQPVIPEVGQ